MFRKLTLILFISLTLSVSYAQISQREADSIEQLLNQQGIACDKSCPLFHSENMRSRIINVIFIDILIGIATAWLYSNYKKKYVFIIGGIVILLVTGSMLLGRARSCPEQNRAECPIVQSDTMSVFIDDYGDTLK